jgi:GNAT superfamily N-acetyltransferase
MQLDALCDHQLFRYPDAHDFPDAPSHRLAKAVRSHISGWIKQKDFDDNTSFSPKFVDTMCWCWVEFILNATSKSSINAGDAAQGHPDESVEKQGLREVGQGWDRQGVLGKFLTTQDMSLVDAHPALAKLDNPEALAQVFLLEFQRISRQARDKAYEDFSLATTVLHVRAQAPAALGLKDGAHLELTVQAKTDSSTDTGIERSLSFWTYSATLGLVNSQSRTFEPVALVKGLNISPFRLGAKGNAVRASTEAFLDQMDAHSQDAIYVAEALVVKLLPHLGWRGIEEFATNNPGGGFLTFRLEVLPEYRGKGLSAIALKLLTQAFHQHRQSEWNFERLRRTPIPGYPAHGPFVLGKPSFAVGVVFGEEVEKVRRIGTHLEQLSQAAGLRIVTVGVDLPQA